MLIAPNLTKQDAAFRAENLKIDNYKINIDLTGIKTNKNTDRFRTITEVKFSANCDSTFIDLMSPHIYSALLNGEKLNLSDYSSQKGLKLPNLQADNKLVIEADFLFSSTGEGLHKFIDPADGEIYLYTQFETADAKRVFACFDQPNLKAKFEIKISSPAGWNVVSNSAVDKLIKNENTWNYSFLPTKPLSTYLVALIAGPYTAWQDEYVSPEIKIPLGIYCRKSLSKFMDADRIFLETKQGFDFYHQTFQYLYPFGKYDQIFVPEFNAGAMENAGAVTFRDEYVFSSKVTEYRYERRADTILHEMAHMWFGDLVTMRWWEDLWLNESFASFASILAQTSATKYKNSWATFATVEKSWAYNQDQLPTTHPVAANVPDHEAVEVNFDGITYAKGASLLKQLVAYVGLADFIAGLRIYFKKYQFSNASYADLITCLSEVTSKDLKNWSELWLKTTGINELRAEYELDNSTNTFKTFTINQTGAKPGRGELRPHHIAIGLYSADATGKIIRTQKIETDLSENSTSIADLEGIEKPDFILLNDEDLDYCHTYFNKDSLEFLQKNITNIVDPLPRAVIWTSTLEMVRNERLKSSSFIELALKGLEIETDLGVVEFLLRNIQLAIADYTDQNWAKATGYDLIASSLLNLIKHPDTDADRRLAFVNTLTALNYPTSATSQLYALLKDRNSTTNWAKTTIDDQLYWNILQHLAVVNFADIDIKSAAKAYLEKDNTAAGKLNFENTLACINSVTNKKEYWDKIISFSNSLSITRAQIAGFTRATDPKLLQEFTAKYFVEVPKIWKSKSNETSQVFTLGLYPYWDETLKIVKELTEKTIENVDSNAAIRLLKECDFRLDRANRLQSYDNLN